MGLNIRSSYDSFRELRENDSFYVDKTAMLEEFLVRRFDKAVLFTRPRRFGKTMTMTMFRDFLDVRQDSRDIFDGLEIMNHPQVVEKYMNKYPVVFISLKEVFGDSFEDVQTFFVNLISTVCKSLTYLIDSDKVDSADKTVFENLRYRKGSVSDSLECLSLIARMLHDHHDKPAFIIIDEYDVPMAKALDKPYYDKVRDMI